MEVRDLGEILEEVTGFLHFGARWYELLAHEKDAIRKVALTKFEDKKQIRQLAKDRRLAEASLQALERGTRALE